MSKEFFMHGGTIRGVSRWGELPAAYAALATLLLTPTVSLLTLIVSLLTLVVSPHVVHADNSLEPIAVASDYVSDLADQVPVAERVMEVTDRLASAAKETAEEPEPIESEVLSFHGITPGISTRINVLRTWGDPRSEETTAAELKYRFGKLKFVYVQFDGDVVDAILVELPKSLPRHRLISNLGLKNIRSTLLTDFAGVPLARTYPERVSDV